MLDEQATRAINLDLLPFSIPLGEDMQLTGGFVAKPAIGMGWMTLPITYHIDSQAKPYKEINTIELPVHQPKDDFMISLFFSEWGMNSLFYTLEREGAISLVDDTLTTTSFWYNQGVLPIEKKFGKEKPCQMNWTSIEQAKPTFKV